MPQDRGTGRNFGRVERAWASILRATMTRALLGATLGLAIGLSAPAYAADNTNDDNTNNSAWSKFMQTLGLKKPADSPDTTINYTERSPLVVPPSRDLPPPAAETAPPVPDWPKDPAKPAKRAKAKPLRPFRRLIRPTRRSPGTIRSAGSTKKNTPTLPASPCVRT
jgi:hypothetical protein